MIYFDKPIRVALLEELFRLVKREAICSSATPRV